MPCVCHNGNVRIVNPNPPKEDTMLLNRLLFLLMLVMWHPRSLLAEEIDPDALLDMSLERLVNLNVATATTYQQRLQDAPASASVITREQIRQHGYKTIADALATLPSVYITYDRSYRFIGVRGLSRPGDYNTRVLTLVDGVRVNDNIFNQGYLGTESIVDISRVERIEFIPGPGASIYGDNAFLAVINIITMSAASNRANEAELSWYDDKTLKTGVEWGSRLAGDGFLRLSADWYDSEGRDWYYPEFGRTAREGDTDQAGKLMLKFEQGGLQLSAYLVQREKRNPSAPYSTDFGDRRYNTEDQQYIVSVNWNQSLTKYIDARLHADIAGFQYWGTFPIEGVINRDKAVGQRQTMDARFTGTNWDSHKWVAGLEVIHDSQQDIQNYDVAPYTSYLSEERDAFKYGIYVQDEWRISNQWHLNIGGRYDHYSAFGGAWNPRTSLIYQPTAASTYKFIYGRALRAPNVYERFYGGDFSFPQKANPDLRPEFVNALELTWDQDWNPNLSTHLGIYRNDIHRMIDSLIDPLDNRYVFHNRLNTVVYGVETGVSGHWQSWRYRANVSVQDAREEETGDWLENSARVLGKVSMDYSFNHRWDVAWDSQYSGRRLTRKGDVPAYLVSRVLLNRNNILPGLSMSIGVENLFNAQYRDPTDEFNVQDTLRQDPRTARILFRWQY